MTENRISIDFSNFQKKELVKILLDVQKILSPYGYNILVKKKSKKDQKSSLSV